MDKKAERTHYVELLHFPLECHYYYSKAECECIFGVGYVLSFQGVWYYNLSICQPASSSFFSRFQCLCFHYSVSRLHTVGLYLDFAKRRTDSEVIYISCNITCHVFKCSNLICNLVWTVDIHTKIALSFYIRSETVNSWLIQLWIWELGGLLYLFLLHLHTSAQYFCHTFARLKKGWSYVKLKLYWYSYEQSFRALLFWSECLWAKHNLLPCLWYIHIRICSCK